MPGRLRRTVKSGGYQEPRQNAHRAFELRYAFAQVGGIAPQIVHVTVHNTLTMQDESGESDGGTEDGDAFGRQGIRFGDHAMCLAVVEARGVPRGAS